MLFSAVKVTKFPLHEVFARRIKVRGAGHSRKSDLCLFFKLPPFATFLKVDILPNLSSQSSQNLNNLHLFPSTFNSQDKRGEEVVYGKLLFVGVRKISHLFWSKSGWNEERIRSCGNCLQSPPKPPHRIWPENLKMVSIKFLSFLDIQYLLNRLSATIKFSSYF